MAVDRLGKTLAVTNVVLVGGNVDAIDGSRVSVRLRDNRLLHVDDTDTLRPCDLPTIEGHSYDFNPGLTSAVVLVEALDSWQFPFTVMRDAQLGIASVGCMHGAGSPPTDWTLEVSKNLSGSVDASYTFFLNASAFTWQTTVASPSGGLDFTAGDTIGFQLTGSSLDGILAQIEVELYVAL